MTAAGTWLGRYLPGAGAAGCVPDGDQRPQAQRAAPLQPDRRSVRVFVVGLIGIAVLPLVEVVAVRVLRDVVFVRGATAGVTGTVGMTGAIMVSGMVLFFSLGPKSSVRGPCRHPLRRDAVGR